MNSIVLMGRLTKEPEVRYATTGTAVGSFSMAVDRRFKKQGQPEADFFNCTAFGKQAEFVEKYLHKGTKIVISGEMQNNNYKDKNGNMQYSFRVLCNSIEFAESKRTAEQNTAQKAQTAPDDGFMDIPDDLPESLPFN